MPGNQERLEHYFGACKAKVLFTLGAEAAGCARGFRTEAEGRKVLYAEPERLNVFGLEAVVVHLVHPGLLVRAKKTGRSSWREKHGLWLKDEGHQLLANHGIRRNGDAAPA